MTSPAKIDWDAPEAMIRVRESYDRHLKAQLAYMAKRAAQGLCIASGCRVKVAPRGFCEVHKEAKRVYERARYAERKQTKRGKL